MNNALDLLKSIETIGYKEREVKFGDVKIVLAPLTSGEIIEIFEESNKYKDIEASSHSLKVNTVARSIIAVNDIEFDHKNMLEQKLSVVSSFGSETVEYLFNEYCTLDKIVKVSFEQFEKR